MLRQAICFAMAVITLSICVVGNHGNDQTAVIFWGVHPITMLHVFELLDFCSIPEYIM